MLSRMTFNIIRKKSFYLFQCVLTLYRFSFISTTSGYSTSFRVRESADIFKMSGDSIFPHDCDQ